MSERSSGRTTRQLAALPDGGVYLVQSQRMVGYCQALLRHIGRRRDAITFATADLSEAVIFGRRIVAWDVDHAYFDAARSDRRLRAYDYLQFAAGKGPVATP